MSAARRWRRCRSRTRWAHRVAEKSLDGLLQRYTDQHPDVVGARKTIEELEAQKIQEIQIRRRLRLPACRVRQRQPGHQQMKMSLAEAEANVASLRARLPSTRAGSSPVRGIAHAAADRDRIHQLNRDYDVNKRNYDALVARRESATMAVEMGRPPVLADFRLIDPPTVPNKPAAPNRLLLMPAAGLAALLMGRLSVS
jgi:uncharacterized protein involved in exopolysaccharide biosynthesis